MRSVPSALPGMGCSKARRSREGDGISAYSVVLMGASGESEREPTGCRRCGGWEWGWWVWHVSSKDNGRGSAGGRSGANGSGAMGSCNR